MLKTIHALRIVTGFIAAWQIVGLLPVLSWLGNIESTTGDMWAIAFIKTVVLLICSALFVWLGRIKRRLDKGDAPSGELRTIGIAITSVAVAGIVAAILIPMMSLDSTQQSNTAVSATTELQNAQTSSASLSSDPLPPIQADPRDALLQMHVEQLSDSQYSAAVDRWLESHPEASSAESRTAMSQLLQEIYNQYPRSALGPALDMALQRGQRNRSSPTGQTAAQSIPAGCVDSTSIEIPARYTGARVTFNFRNVSLQKFLNIIEEESGQKIVAQDDVSRGITTCLINVPWDYALDKVLADNGYGQTEYNGSVRVFKR
jgi:hypothetical protein